MTGGWASRVGLLLVSLLSPTRAVLLLCNMSLRTWEWEEEERGSVGPLSVASAYQSASECEETEEYLKCRTSTHGWDSEDQFSSSLHSSEEPACTFNADVPQVVPCKFIISLAFPPLPLIPGRY